MKVLIVSDLHVGSIVGLWPERHQIEGGGIYEANASQKWLFSCWKKMLAEAQKLRPVVIINGDTIQGVHSKDGQIIGATVSAQCSAAFALLEPLSKAASRLYFIRGTEWHDGKSAQDIEVLAMSLGAVPGPDGQYSRWELYLDIGGAVIHFTHHVGASSVAWYEATVPWRDALMLLSELSRSFRCDMPGVKMIVRSHRHRFIHVNTPDMAALVTPAWQLRTAFVFKKAPALMPHIGYVVLEWDGKDLIAKPRLFSAPPPDVERIVDNGK